MSDEPLDFASVALKMTKTEMPADGSDPKPTPVAKESTPAPDNKEEAASDPKRIPDELFGGKKEEPKAKIEEPKSDFDGNDPEFKDPKRKADWDGLKAKGRDWEKKAKETEAKAAELEKKIAEYDARGKDSEGLQAKLAEQEKQLAEWKQIVQKVNIELDPEFRSLYIEGRSKLITNAKALMEESSLNPKDIEVALNLQGKPRVEALKAIAEEMDGFQQGRLGRLVDQLNDLDQAASAKRSNPDEYFAQTAKQRQEEQNRALQDAERNANIAYDKAEQKTAAELEVLRDVPGLDWWNDQSKKIREEARKVYLQNDDPQVAATVCLQAKAMPVYRDLFLSQREEANKLRTELAEKTAELTKIYGNGSPTLRSPLNSRMEGGKKDFATVAHETMTGR